MSEETSWSAQRSEAAALHADKLAQRRQAEHARAASLLERFAAVARDHLEHEPLQVRGYGGRGSARSNVTGWYLRTDRTAGVDVDGRFYVLTAPLGLRERLRGVVVEPSPPPLVLGAGGKDGDSIDLPDALERLLPGWNTLEGDGG